MTYHDIIDRLRNTKNYNQRYDKYKRVLCLCSGGLLRSPTTAYVLSMEPYNFNTRSAGIDEHHALIAVDDILIEWADEIVVMSEYQKQQVLERWPGLITLIVVLNIPDNFQYRQPQLVERIKKSYPIQLEFANHQRKQQAEAARATETNKPVEFTIPKEGEGPIAQLDAARSEETESGFRKGGATDTITITQDDVGSLNNDF